MALAGGQIIMPWGEKTLPDGSLNVGSSHGALEQHLQRLRRWHQPRDALGAPAAGEEPDLDLRQSDPRLVQIGDDAIVARERQFEAAAHAHAVDRCGYGFAAGFEPSEDQWILPDAIDEGAHRSFLAFGLGAARVFMAGGFQHPDGRGPRGNTL